MTASTAAPAPAWGTSPTSFATAPVTRPRLILVAIDKGGVGKSFFCIQLICWLRQLRVAYTAYDPDHANSSLSRFINDAIFINARHSENLDAMVDRLAQTPIVVLDGMVGRQGLIFDWMDETNLTTVASRMGFGVTMVLVIEDDKDAIHQAGEAVKRFGNRVQWLVVKNKKVTERFDLYQNSRARAMLLEHQALEMELPRLAEHLNGFLQLNSMTIDAALASHQLSILDRQRLVQYRRTLHNTLDTVRHVLL
jgi:hypothetical protein